MQNITLDLRANTIAAQSVELAIQHFSRRTHDLPILRSDWHRCICALAAFSVSAGSWPQEPHIVFKERLRSHIERYRQRVLDIVLKSGFKLSLSPSKPTLLPDDTKEACQEASPLGAEAVGTIYSHLRQRLGDAPAHLMSHSIEAFCHWQLAVGMVDDEAPPQYRLWSWHAQRLSAVMEETAAVKWSTDLLGD